MAMTTLRNPIRSADSVRLVNFFNGRLLSGEDLTHEQSAQIEARRQLGLAMGTGIVNGLTVSERKGQLQPTLRMTAGTALNTNGVSLTLYADVDVTLTDGGEEAVESGTGAFAPCAGTRVTAQLAGTDVYLLVLCPAEMSEGRAPVSGLANIDAGCNTRYTVETVQFRLIALKASAADLAKPLLVQNRVAMGCIEPAFALDAPFGNPTADTGYLAKLREKGELTICDVPLATIFWMADKGIQFVDMHTVRRRLHPAKQTFAWSSFYDDHHIAEREARFLQFQDQIEARYDLPSPGTLRAADYFHELPAAGVIPLASTRWPIGFSEAAFFAGMTLRNQVGTTPNIIEGAQIENLIAASFHFPPIQVESKVLVWSYRVRENRQAVAGPLASEPQEYLVFANGHMPFMGDARYDVNRWAYSNFS